MSTNEIKFEKLQSISSTEYGAAVKNTNYKGCAITFTYSYNMGREWHVQSS